MPQLTDRLIHVTQELIAINSELEQDVNAVAGGAESGITAGYAVLNTFKGVVDHTRHLLWPFVVAAHRRSEENLTVILQGYRMTRIREMLSALKTDDQSGPSDTVKLFLAEVERIAHQPAQRPN
jgi:hypothetical protein